MSILNTQDVEQQVEEAVMRPGYRAAVEDYGELGGNLWRALQHAVQNIGLTHETSISGVMGWQGGRPVYRQGSPTGYNLEELGQEATKILYEMGSDVGLVLDWIEFKQLDPKWIDDTQIHFIGRYYTGQCSTSTEIRLFYSKSEVEKQGPFGLHF